MSQLKADYKPPKLYKSPTSTLLGTNVGNRLREEDHLDVIHRHQYEAAMQS